MMKLSLLLLAALSSVAANTNDFFDQVELIEYKDNDLEGLDYDNLFNADFTVTVFGVAQVTGGGENDLKKFGKYFLKKFNQVQRKVQKQIAKAEGNVTVEEPGVLMFETEVVEQYLSSTANKNQETVSFNMLEIQSSLVCVEEACPTALVVDGDSTTPDARRQLEARRLVSVADTLKGKLIASGRDYFAKTSCVRVTSSLTTFVDESDGCADLPVVVIKPVVDEEA